ncbi:Crp/Fnr family transcriptional regulator, partial [Rhizobium leguminosarum]|uniref:Crp/Fnr family transcriptional regulator n=1 Tax=Rhizobium leguminosarum TaxID=384 RepID=UPI003F973D88
QFYPLTDKEFELFSSDFFINHFHPKQQMTKEGDVEENIYYVAKGIFRKYFRRDKEEIVTGFYKEMDICVSVVSYFTGMPSTLIIEAIEPSVCLG